MIQDVVYYSVELYSDCEQIRFEWNQFVCNSRQGTFLLLRDYMNYHSDRFEDFSLLIYKNNKLNGLFPANRVNDTVYSHQGLTYGGLLTTIKSTITDVIDMFAAINSFLASCGVSCVVYKAIPYIYHTLPAQEDLYALYRLNAKLISRSISSVIYQHSKIKFNELRRRQVKKALKSGVYVKGSDDFQSFWKILSDNLHNKYGVFPVHSLEEIKLLNNRFPNNILLYMAYKDNVVLGGVVVYLSKSVCHAQYISASSEGKELGALDLIFDKLINEIYSDYLYFDFGQSTENNGNYLNSNLIFQKEGFGGRGVCYDVYKYDIE